MFKLRLGWLVMFIVIVLALLLAVMPVAVLAQDAPEEPDVTATPDPLPAEPEPGGLSSIVTFLTGALAGGITSLLAVLGVVSQLKTNKQALDTIEYLSRNTIPLEVLARFNELAKAIQDAGAVLDVVTDGQPNESPALPTIHRTRSARAEPPPPL